VFERRVLATTGTSCCLLTDVYGWLYSLANSPDVSKISFTGSTSVGKLLMKQSSSTLKKLSFELGGNAP
jgi:hypothetical protein